MQDIMVLEKEQPVVNLHLVAEVARSLASITFKASLIGLVAFSTIKEIKTTNSQMFVPMKIESKESIDSKRTNEALKILNCPTEKVAVIKDSVLLGAKASNVDPVLIAVLMSTESEFSLTAKSSKGYKGLMQTASSTKIAEVDTVHGAMILKEKLQIAKGDIRTALCFYKGSPYLIKNGKKSLGLQQADQVLAKYKKVLDNIKIV